MSELFDIARPMDAARTLALYSRYYQDNGPALPAGRPDDMRFIERLSDKLDALEGLILDSYGVILNYLGQEVSRVLFCVLF